MLVKVLLLPLLLLFYMLPVLMK